jgi:CheY-like chemotaxis protein
MSNPIPFDLLTDWDVVIVDDEDDSLEVARYILDFYGAHVHTGVNGREGLELAQTVLPKFVIADLSMPVMDGWEMLNELKADLRTTEIPVIALTAHAMVGDRERAMAAGFHNYLTKPLTADTFIQQLVSLLVDIPILADQLNI